MLLHIHWRVDALKSILSCVSLQFLGEPRFLRNVFGRFVDEDTTMSHTLNDYPVSIIQYWLCCSPFLWVLLQTEGDHLPEGLAVLLYHLFICDARLQPRRVILQSQHQHLPPNAQVVISRRQH